MALTALRVCAAIDSFAPFALAEAWDNVGLLAGSPDMQVRGILCALELNPMVLEEALRQDCNLIVTHHPILFHARKNLREDVPEGAMLCALVRNQMALIAAHTNFDNAAPGVNDALAERLALENVEAGESGLRAGVPQQATLGAFADHVRQCLVGAVRVYGEPERAIRRVAVLGGAGGDFALLALSAGADVYLTGEIAHHKAWDAYLRGLCVLEAGHAATELPAIDLLVKGLQNALHGVQWNERIYRSEVELFR